MTQRTEIDTQLSKAQRVPQNESVRIMTLENQIEHLNNMLEILSPYLGTQTQEVISRIVKRSRESLKEDKS
ncbi:MAG TPA: hypothetical protein PLY25_09825 [Bacteroidia bacterium]|nr:hypothetical protein [Bacteroidia bacterium]